MKKIFPALFALCLLLGASATVASAQSLDNLTSILATHDGSEQTSVAELGNNKVTMVSFFAMWCGPCKKEMQAMQPIIEELKAQGKQVEYIAVSIDDTKSMARVRPYIDSKGYTFPVLMDPSKELFNMLAGTNVPYSLIFKADGSLSSKHEGFLEGDEAKLRDELLELEAAAQTGDAGSGGTSAE